jgi:hypothetical protein
MSDRPRNAAKSAYIWTGGFCYAMYLLATSRSAIRLYKAAWSLIMTARAWVMVQVDDYVASCLEVPAVEHLPAVEPETEAIAPESPQPAEVDQPSEPVEDVWEMPIESVCLLASESAIGFPTTPLLMPAKEEVAQPKTRKTAAKTPAKKTTTRKQGGKAKATAEKV